MLNKLSVAYDNRSISLENITTVAILGDNGVGKTAFLERIAVTDKDNVSTILNAKGSINYENFSVNIEGTEVKCEHVKAERTRVPFNSVVPPISETYYYDCKGSTKYKVMIVYPYTFRTMAHQPHYGIFVKPNDEDMKFNNMIKELINETNDNPPSLEGGKSLNISSENTKTELPAGQLSGYEEREPISPAIPAEEEQSSTRKRGVTPETSGNPHPSGRGRGQGTVIRVVDDFLYENGDNVTYLDNLGRGISNMVKLLWFVYYYKPDILLIDDIESLSLHPKRLQMLLKWFVEYIRDNKLKAMLFTTNSDAYVDLAEVDKEAKFLLLQKDNHIVMDREEVFDRVDYEDLRYTALKL